MAAVRPITSEDVESFWKFFKYNPDNGSLVWVVRTGSRSNPGSEVGAVRPDGYKSLMLNKRLLFVHRVCYCMATGKPLGANDLIDHINGDKADNRADNLRAVDHQTNVQNTRKPNRRSESGFLGVQAEKRPGRSQQARKFAAKIGVTLEGGKKKLLYLGTFSTPEAAHQAYLEAKRRLHPGCTI